MNGVCCLMMLIQVMALHEAMGFGRGRGEDGGLDSIDHLLSKQLEVSQTLSNYQHNDREQQHQQPSSTKKKNSPVLVTSVDSARGLDFGGVMIDCVLILGRATSPDEYQHVAGRTGRRGNSGVAISILSYVDIKKLASWEAMLGIKFEKDDAVRLIPSKKTKTTTTTKNSSNSS